MKKYELRENMPMFCLEVLKRKRLRLFKLALEDVDYLDEHSVADIVAGFD